MQINVQSEKKSHKICNEKVHNCAQRYICSGQSVAGLDKSRRFIPICPTALRSAPVKFLQGESYICLHLAKKVIIIVTNNFAVKISHIFQFYTLLMFMNVLKVIYIIDAMNFDSVLIPFILQPECSSF